MKQFTIALLLSIPFFLQAQSEAKINWLSWDEAVELQKQEPKMVFIDVYTDWCGWCKKMDQSTFKDPKIIEAMNKYYYAVKLDAEMAEEITFNGHTFVNPAPAVTDPKTGRVRKGTHTLAASLLDNQMSYPSFVVLDQNMTRTHIIKGYQKVNPLNGILYFFGTGQYQNYRQYILYEQSQIQMRQQNAQAPAGSQ